MKKFFLIIILFMSAFIFTGCSSSRVENSTEFFRNFSFAEIVSQNDQFMLSGYQGSGGEFGPSKPFLQRLEDIVFQIEDADIPFLLDAIKRDIQDEISSGGAKVDGGGSGTSHKINNFSISYRQDGAYGVINVWGVRGEGTSYYLISDITEYCCGQ